MFVDIVYGFLGSGKTTFIKRLLQKWGGSEKIVVLVNEFGEVGIDGTLLEGQGGDVVEMPSGCICCTLQADFRSQMLDIGKNLKPERVIIEPTGVATIVQIQSIISAELFEDFVDTIHNILVLDAIGFMKLFRANPHFVESQIKNAHLVLLNKCDLVDKTKARVTRDAVLSINPGITVLMTEFGAVDWADYTMALSTASIGSTEAQIEKSAAMGMGETLPVHGSAGSHKHAEEDGLGHESFGFTFKDEFFDQQALMEFFEKLKSGGEDIGEVVRAKGIFKMKDGWMLMELASGQISFQPVRETELSKVLIIGKRLKKEKTKKALEQCVASGR